MQGLPTTANSQRIIVLGSSIVHKNTVNLLTICEYLDTKRAAWTPNKLLSHGPVSTWGHDVNIEHFTPVVHLVMGETITQYGKLLT